MAPPGETRSPCAIHGTNMPGPGARRSIVVRSPRGATTSTSSSGAWSRPARLTAVAENAAAPDLSSERVAAFIALLKERKTVVDPTLGAFEGDFTDRPGRVSATWEPVVSRLPAQIQREADQALRVGPILHRQKMIALQVQAVDPVQRDIVGGLPNYDPRRFT